MTDQSQVLKGVAYDVYCQFHTADTGALIANPTGLAGRKVNEASPTGAATTNAPTRVDSTAGIVHLQLTATEMNSDYVFVAGKVQFKFALKAGDVVRFREF